jgi:hydroxypyruvate reductase
MSDGRDPRALLRALFDGAVQGALPFDATWEWAAEIPITAPVHLFVLGKAAHAQGRGVISALADRGIVPVGGVMVAVAHQAAPHPTLRVVVGDHPLPGARSAAAARAIGEALARISAGDQIIACVSGGTTSLCAAARDHSSSDVLAERFRQLLADGTDIIRMNAERRSWLQWADGRLSEACQNAGASRIDVGVVSDVIGDDLRSIGCGPFLTDDRRVHHTVIASNVVAQDAAERLARAARCDVVRVPVPLQGDARTAGRAFAEQLLTAPRGARPTIVIAGGEPTMTLEAAPPDAAGGRMQAFALAAAIVLHEARERGVPTRAVTILAGGTDGRDGPTDAAGATVDAATVRRIAQSGRNAKQELAHHRSYHVLAAAGQLMRTGPTGTNVADLVLGYVPPGAPS